MSSFLTLTGFEYKKIFKRKSAIIALITVTAAVCFSPFAVFFGTSYLDGEPFESHYESMVKDREYAKALSGRAIDAALLLETKEAYLKIPEAAVSRFGVTPEYQQYVRPYSEIIKLMFAAYNLNMEGLRNLTEEDLRGFYQERHENVAASIRAGALSDAAKDKLIQLDSKIKTPFVFADSVGIDNLAGGIYSLGIAGSFALAICLAPMFAGEYSTRADQLILSAKHGKRKLLSAKIFTAISLLVIFFLLWVLLTVVLCMSIYGLDGWDAPLQLLLPLLAYPLTIAENVLIFSVCTFGGMFLTMALTLWLSAKFKSPFGVIIIISVLLFVPMMFNVPETVVWLHNLFSLLPASMMSVWVVFAHVPFELFGLIAPPYIALPVFAMLASAILLPFAKRGFKNHQIG